MWANSLKAKLRDKNRKEFAWVNSSSSAFPSPLSPFSSPGNGFKQKPFQGLLKVSFGFCIKCLELKAAFCLFVSLGGGGYVFPFFSPSSSFYLTHFWNARFSCWSNVNSFLTLCFSKIWAKIGTVQFLEKLILSLPVSGEVILGKLSQFHEVLQTLLHSIGFGPSCAQEFQCWGRRQGVLLNADSNWGKGELFTWETLPHKGLERMLGALKWCLNNNFPGVQISEHIHPLPFPLARVPSCARETKARPGCVVSFRQWKHFVWFSAYCPFCLAASGWCGLRHTRMGRMCHSAGPKSSFSGAIPSTVPNLPSPNWLQDIPRIWAVVSFRAMAGSEGGEALPPPQLGVTSAPEHRLRTGWWVGLEETSAGGDGKPLSSAITPTLDTEPEGLQFLAGPELTYGMCNHTEISSFTFYLPLVWRGLSRAGCNRALHLGEPPKLEWSQA